MSSETNTMLQALHVDLDALKNAIDGEDHEQAERIVSEHDQRLRDYIQAHGAASAAPALQSLLAQQQALIERMRELRDEAAAHLRQERQSVRAASAYQQAGALP